MLSASSEGLSLYELLSLVISLVGFAAVVISLILLRVQTRQMTLQTKLLTDTFRESAYEGMANRMLELDQIFITYPEMHPYFYEGAEISEDHPDYNRAWAIAEAMMDYFDAINRAHRSTLESSWWQSYLADSFASSPILCEYLQRAHTWYDPELIEVMQRAQRRDSWTPPLKKDPSSTHGDDVAEVLVAAKTTGSAGTI